MKKLPVAIATAVLGTGLAISLATAPANASIAGCTLNVPTLTSVGSMTCVIPGPNPYKSERCFWIPGKYVVSPTQVIRTGEVSCVIPR